MRPAWIKDESRDGIVFDYKASDSQTRSYVSVYEGREDTFYKVERGAAALSGILDSIELAMIEAERLIALPIDDFNTIAIKELRKEMACIERKILRIAPTAEFMPGYSTGFNDGRQSIRDKIFAVME